MMICIEPHVTITYRLSDARHFGVGVFDVGIWHWLSPLLISFINNISAQVSHDDRDGANHDVPDTDKHNDRDGHIFIAIRQSSTDA
jgi:hypothetical protein